MKGYTNEQLIDMFHNQKLYTKFGEFLDNLEELKPCFSCEKNGLPNCGNDYCSTRQDKGNK